MVPGPCIKMDQISHVEPNFEDFHSFNSNYYTQNWKATNPTYSSSQMLEVEWVNRIGTALLVVAKSPIASSLTVRAVHNLFKKLHPRVCCYFLFSFFRASFS